MPPARDRVGPRRDSPPTGIGAVLPGKPQPALRAVTTAKWDGLRLVAYVSGSSLILLRGPNDLLQTISHADDTQLSGAAIDPHSGKIAVTDGSQVFIYQPIGRDYGALRWTLQTTYTPPGHQSPISCLSWGLPGELLIACSIFILLTTDASLRTIWHSRPLANPVKLALFSHDASLFASTGHKDRLVKIWRRGFIGGGNERFDPVYIGHPAAVTDLWWRSHAPSDEDDGEQHAEPVLYTTCTDGKLRTWTVVDPHCLQVLQLWSEIDMFTAIQPREPLSPGAGKKRRFVSTLDHWDFEASISAAAELPLGEEREQYTRKHLAELAERRLEIAIILDDEGNMSAWGQERVACKARHPNDLVNIANVEGLGLRFINGMKAREDFLQLRLFTDGPDVHVLGQFFDGRLQWLRSPVDRLFDPSPKPEALQLCAELTGHADPIERLFSGQSVTVSCSRSGEIIVWENDGSTLVRRSAARVAGEVVDCRVIARDRLAIILYSDVLRLYDYQHNHLVELCQVQLDSGLKPLRLGPLTRPTSSRAMLETSIVVSSLQIISYSIALGSGMAQMVEESRTSPIHANTLTNGLSNGEALREASPHTHAAFLSSKSLLTYSPNSSLQHWTFRPEHQHLKHQSTENLYTDNASLVCASSPYVACTDEDSTTLRVWNRLTGHLEHSKQYDRFDPVLELKWCSHRGFSSSILAVVHAHRVTLYAPPQLSWDSKSAWIQILETNVSELTNIPIADASWLSSHGLLIAAGNQMFVLDLAVSVPEDIAKLLHLSKDGVRRRSLYKFSRASQECLPIYHPLSIATLLQCLGMKPVNALVQRLDSTLKYFAEGDAFDSMLGYSRSISHSSNVENDFAKLNINGDTAGAAEDIEPFNMNDDARSELMDRIPNLPYLNDESKVRVGSLIRSVGELNKHEQSIDDFGTKYLASVLIPDNTSQAHIELPWQAIFNASQSTSHDVLVDQTIQQHQNRLTWQVARRTGLFLWLSDTEALRTHLETLARAEYTKTEERNPIDCSLYYLALHKKSVLTNLWRMATWHKEQRATHKMLQNDFTQPRWKTAALKNAYALLGKRRPEYAAAWFLLADDLRAAVGVLATQCADLRLAVTIARAHEGDSGPVLRDLLHGTVLPAAAAARDRWMAAWAFWLLGRQDAMLRAFIDPWPSLVPSASDPPPIASHAPRAPDLALAHAYQAARAAVAADPRAAPAARGLDVAREQRLAARCAHLFMRAGMGWLAVDLLRSFNFSTPTTARPIHSARDTETKTPSPTSADADASMHTAAADPSVPSALDAFLGNGDGDGDGDGNAAGSASASGAPDGPDGQTSAAPAAPAKKAAVAPSEASILDDFDF